MDTVDEYIASCAANVRPALRDVRAAIVRELPDDHVECIRWGMPTYKLGGTNVVHFAAAKAHLGFYPAPEAIVEFAGRLTGFSTSKGAIRFPFDEPVPLDLIGEITRWRVGQLTSGSD